MLILEKLLQIKKKGKKVKRTNFLPTPAPAFLATNWHQGKKNIYTFLLFVNITLPA